MKEKFCQYHWHGNMHGKVVSLGENEGANLLCVKDMTKPGKIKICPYTKDEIFYTPCKKKYEIANCTKNGLENFCYDFALNIKDIE